jgi:arabinofuranosyltransferase
MSDPEARGQAPPVLDTHLFLTASLLSLFTIAVIRTAWMSDDAYITLRTVDNFVSGFGLRWNVVERVQTYTHPLWMFVLSVPYFVTREAYFTPLILSILLSLAAVWLVMRRLAGSVGTAVICGTVLTFSKSFVEYSTSGLENPLTHLLLAIFFLAYWSPDTRRCSINLWFVAALLMLNRLDTGLLVLPALLARAHHDGWRPTARAMVLGLAPLAIWEVFSVVYYGFPFPNTAYAKLQTGVEPGALAMQGWVYLLDCAWSDPVTLFAMSVFAITSLGTRPRESWPVVLGILLYVVYVVRVGGDFMSGRFFTAPLFCAVVLISRFELPRGSLFPSAATATIVALGIFATSRPPLTSQEDVMNPPAQRSGFTGVTDQRAFYYRYTGLLRWTRDVPLPHFQWETEGREARANPGIFVRGQVGLFGYFAGPAVHVVDVLGLGDPLLARLPAQPKWRAGHFQRSVPDGYIRTLETGRNVIVDPDVAVMYARLQTITRDPLWSGRRWRAIADMNGWR